MDALLREQRRHTGDYLLQLPAVGSGVHTHAAAYCPGDAVGEFQSRQPPLAGKVRQPGQGNARSGENRARLFPVLQTAEPGGLNHQPVQPLVRGQQVGAVPDYQRTGSALPGHGQQQYHLLPLFGKRHPFRRSPCPKGCVLCHRLFPQELYIR